MNDCQCSAGGGHVWSVTGHSTGPRPLLFLQCVGCGNEQRLALKDDEWDDYLSWLNEAGMQWVDRHLSNRATKDDAAGGGGARRRRDGGIGAGATDSFGIGTATDSYWVS